MMKYQLFYVVLVTIVLLTVVSTAAATTNNNYVGHYTIQSVYNNQGMEVVLPANNVFSVNINTSSSPDNESATSSSSVSSSYVVAMKIGNAMTTTMSVTPNNNGSSDDIVTFGYIMSTRMLPPPEINEVEMTVSDLLRSSSASITSITLDESESGMILTITNGVAKLVCVSSEG